MSSKLIYVEDDYDSLYGKFWGNLGQVCRSRKDFLAAPEKFDLVCFTGGEDVSPELYGHQNLASGNSLARDEREEQIFDIALEHGIPMTGICRGTQFLNVMCGGTMVQHLRKSHGGGHHRCETIDGKLFEVTSSHHQMIVPPKGAEVLAWAEQRLSLADLVYAGPERELNAVRDYDLKDGVKVTESIYYPEFKVFGVQHHPEWQDVRMEAPQWTLHMIRKLLFQEKEMSA